MRENRTYGSEGGEAKAFPTPISRGTTTKRRGKPGSRRKPLSTASWLAPPVRRVPNYSRLRGNDGPLEELEFASVVFTVTTRPAGCGNAD